MKTRNIFLALLALCLILALTACGPAPPPVETPTPVPSLTPSPTPNPSEPGYIFSHKIPFEDWPEKIAGLPVGYVRVGNEDAGLEYAQIWEENYKLFVIFGEAYNDRIIAKPGKWLAAFARGDIWGISPWPRPFFGDGWNHAYQVMGEQIVDGILIGEAGEVLFIPLSAVDQWFDPRTDTFGGFDPPN